MKRTSLPMPSGLRLAWLSYNWQRPDELRASGHRRIVRRSLWTLGVVALIVAHTLATPAKAAPDPMPDPPEVAPLPYDPAEADALVDRWWACATDAEREATIDAMRAAGVTGLEAAALALEMHRRPPNLPSWDTRRDKALADLIASDPPTAMAALADRIVRPREAGQRVSIWWARDILPSFDPAAVDPILGLAQRGDRQTRVRAIEALSLMVGSSTLLFDLCVDRLSDEYDFVRRAAAQALKWWTPQPPAPFEVSEQSRQALWNAMTNERAMHDVREAAAVALSRLRIEPDRLESCFLAELGRTDNNPQWRETAISGFAYVCKEPDRIIATLTPLIQGDRPSRTALFALCEHAAHPDLPIERMFELRKSARYWKGESNKLFEVADHMGPRAVPYLVVALQDEHEFDRRGAMSALAKIGPAAGAAVEPLLAYIEDPEIGDDSKPDAVRALNQIAPDSRGVDERLLAYIIKRAADPAIHDPAGYSARRTIAESLRRPTLHERVATGDYERIRMVWPGGFK